MSFSSDSVPDPLAQRVRSTPNRTALVDAGTGQLWSYDALDGSVEDAARRLTTLGLEPGDQLGLLATTSVPAVRTIHAAWRLGLTLVPLSVRLTEPELTRQASLCDIDALVYDGELSETAKAVADCPLVPVDSASMSSPEEARGFDERVDVSARARERTSGKPVGPSRSVWERDETALVLFTSGTTGEPKGVELTMGNLHASATASAFRLGVLPSDRWLLCLPVYHMGGLAPVLRSALYGTTLVVLDGFDPGAVARTCRDYGATGLSLVPTQLDRILDYDPEFGGTVRSVLLGGAPAPTELIERCRRLDVPVYPTYGLTETASQVATATPEQAFEYEGTVGQPLLGTQVTIVDENHRPLPPGETGEIVVAGPSVTPGYHNDDEATERAFCRHGLLTGDLGHRDEAGRLSVSGRRTDRIVTGGENVDPAEVAGVLREHGGVSEAVVVGLPDPEWGERVAALVVSEAQRDPDADALIAFCRQRIAGFKVPRTVGFAEELPRTASGTVDRAAVRDRLAE